MPPSDPVTEEEWRSADGPARLLAFVQCDERCAPQDRRRRKLHLFCAACCRLAWHLFTINECRQAVDAAELAADGLLSAHKISRSTRDVRLLARTMLERFRALGTQRYGSPEFSEAARRLSQTNAAEATLSGVSLDVVRSCTVNLLCWEAGENSPGFVKRHLNATRLQADLVRCIFGNPFRPVAFDPRWLTSTVIDLARAAYEGRAWERLPILADALMDAGCDDEQVLGHCHGPGPHARGCWVVDAILGKCPII
jgi:hypothetical protein